MKWPFLKKEHREQDHAEVAAAVEESHVLLDKATEAVKKVDELQDSLIDEYAEAEEQRMKNGHARKRKR